MKELQKNLQEETALDACILAICKKVLAWLFHLYNPNGNGEISLAVAAMESSVSTADAMVLSAERADNVILVPTGLEDSLAALVLGVEVRSEFVYAIELAEVNHKSQA